MKIKKEIQKEIRSERQTQSVQARLREKYDVKDNIYVVEKNSLLLFMQRMVGGIFKVTLNVLLISLATIGLLALIYPGSRAEVFKIFEQMIRQIHLLKT